MKRIAIIGGGWAGCAAAVRVADAGDQVTLFEAARHLGGRARRFVIDSSEGQVVLDNGQHILIGAYSETLALMARLGIGEDAFLRIPMGLRAPDGSGLQLPRSDTFWGQFPRLSVLRGVLSCPGWAIADKLSLLRLAAGWELRGFTCSPNLTVAQLCASATPQLMASLIEPLCVSALNTPASTASAAVFLRVLHDAMFMQSAGSDYLLPMRDLSALLPDAAAAYITQRGGMVHFGMRVRAIVQESNRWCIQLHSGEDFADTKGFDNVIVASPPAEAARLCEAHNPNWAATAGALRYEAITTCYAWASLHDRKVKTLASPVLALPSDASKPAQFVFDRGQLGGPAGLLAFVVSASHASVQDTQAAIVGQARQQLGLQEVQILETITEKRATFACTPGVRRPTAQVCPGIAAVGDYIAGPYPATLEGAVRSAQVV